MSGLLWRVIIAVICVVLAFAVIPPLLRILGLDISGDVMTIVRVCIGGLALLYILTGSKWFGTA